ncbi:M23 family metallopeptidase [Maricaulaceae bacterium EIL42A08]|nr:M23 family metallopeptidase [Maricaulaceae bacterium EIL42A08]
MSGFNVRLAQAQRSRTLIFFFSVGGALALIALLLIARTSASGSDTAQPLSEPVLVSEAESEPTLETASLEPSTAADTATDMTLAEPAVLASLDFNQDLIQAEHNQFAGRSVPSVTSIDAVVRRGQTFASVLDNAGASRVDAARAIAALEPMFSARRLRAGQRLTIFMEAPSEADRIAARINEEELPERWLAGFSFQPDEERTLTVARVGNQFRVREAVRSLERQIVRATGEVESSLYLSAIEAGATDRIVGELANVLGFAVDFRTIQPGDDFDVVFERFVNRRGETIRTGDILYVVFDGRGDPLEYFRFEAPDGEVGFFTADGESAQRLLMKMPINGARISSSFGMRFHPILERSRPHNGTDFAAPRGTPIMAAGAGVVERANRFGSFGNYIRIQHTNGYETAYAHLQGFARGIRSGSRVQQGQIIGYVGTTGRSTGPHLHYEVHLNGRPTNPMALELPTERTLGDDELNLFEAERDRIIAIRDGAPMALAAIDEVASANVLLAQGSTAATPPASAGR